MERSQVIGPDGPCGDRNSESQNLAVFESQFSSLTHHNILDLLRKPYGMSLETTTVALTVAVWF